MERYRVDAFVRYLTKKSRGEDVKIFNLWNNNFITTQEAIERFKINNQIPRLQPILKEDFKEWLNSLGYRSGGKKNEDSK